MVYNRVFIHTDLNSVESALRVINENGIEITGRICYPVFNMLIRKEWITLKSNIHERKNANCDAELTELGLLELRRIVREQ